MTNTATQSDILKTLKEANMFAKLTNDTQSFTKGRSGLSPEDEVQLI